jgi:hypothetical protein
MELKRTEGEVDFSDWNFDYGPPAVTEAITKDFAEVIERSLTDNPATLFVHADGEAHCEDLEFVILLKALGNADDVPAYKFRLSEMIVDYIANTGNDQREACQELREAFANALKRLNDTLTTLTPPST